MLVFLATRSNVRRQPPTALGPNLIRQSLITGIKDSR